MKGANSKKKLNHKLWIMILLCLLQKEKPQPWTYYIPYAYWKIIADKKFSNDDVAVINQDEANGS